MTTDIVANEGAGPGADVRWNLAHLYPDPAEDAIDRDLDDSLRRAEAFAARYRGRIAALPAKELAEALDEYESLHDSEDKAIGPVQFCGRELLSHVTLLDAHHPKP